MNDSLRQPSSNREIESVTTGDTGAMSEQDELLRAKILGTLLTPVPDIPKRIEMATKLTEEILAKVKHNKQNNTLMVKGTEHPEERIPIYKPEQKRLDRPELREKIAKYLAELDGWVWEKLPRHYDTKRFLVAPQAPYLGKADEILALIPDIEELQLRLNQTQQKLMNFGINYKSMIEEAEKQVVDFIESYLVTTIEPDGTEMHHIDDQEWQSVKQRILRQALEEER